MASYEVTVTAEGRKTPLLRYKGPADTPGGFRVTRSGGEVRLVWGDVVLDIAKDPGRQLTLHRQDLDADLNPKGKAASWAAD